MIITLLGFTLVTITIMKANLHASQEKTKKEKLNPPKQHSLRYLIEN